MATKGEHRETGTVVVRVRVPCRSDADLVTDAEERLSRGDGVADATVEGIRSLDPGLSATIVTVRARFRLTGGEVGLEERLADVSGLELVERFE